MFKVLFYTSIKFYKNNATVLHKLDRCLSIYFKSVFFVIYKKNLLKMFNKLKLDKIKFYYAKTN